MKDSGVPWIGEIPVYWKTIRLKYISKLINGFAFKSQDLKVDGYYKVVRIGDLNNNKINLEDCLGVDVVDNYRDYKVCMGDALVALSGATVGKVAFADNNIECYINQRVGIIRSFWSRLIFHIFSVDKFIENLKSCLNDSAQPNLSIEDIGRISIPIYDKTTIKRIVRYLDDKCAQIDTIIAKERSVIEKLQEYKQSVITEAVIKGLDPKVDMIESGINWIKTIPITWKVSKLKYVADFSPKCDFSEVEPDTEVTYTPMEYIKKGNYIPNSEAIGKLSASLTRYEEGDIVIAKVTPCFENGNIAIMNNLKSGKGLGSSELFVFRVPEAIRKFVYYWMQNKLFIEQCVATMTGTGGLKRESSYYISNSEILLPPSELIDDICNYLDEKCELIERTIHQKELVINRLTEYKQSLIYEVVTGKKEVSHV